MIIAVKVNVFLHILFFFLISIIISKAQVTLPSPESYSVGEGSSCAAVALSSNIIITESVATDFSNGTNVSYTIELPYGFEFANTDPNSIIVNYSTLSGSSTYTIGSSANAFNFPSGRRRRFQFYYTITNTGNDVGRFTLSNISVTCYDAGSFGNIVRSGGNAGQAGNAPGNALSHGFLDSRASISCVTYNPTSTTLVPLTAPHVSCSNGYLYFSSNQFPSATYVLREGNTVRSSTVSGAAGSGTYYLPGIEANSAGGMTYFNIEVTKTNGCLFRSEDIDFNFTTTPIALQDFTDVPPPDALDTIFPKSAPVVDLNSYLSLAASDEVTNFWGASLGIFNTGGNSFVFDPGSVTTGPYTIRYTLTNGTCSKSYSLKHRFTVYDPLEPPPDYIRAVDGSGNPKTYPFCENGGNFNIYFRPPDGKILTYVYLYRESGSQYGSVSLSVDEEAGPYSVNPKTDAYNGRLYCYIYYKDVGNTDNYQYFLYGYITIFPERRPQLLGLPAHTNDTLLLCTVGKDSIIMHANPIGGQYIIEKYEGSTYTTLTGPDLTLFAQRPTGAPDNSYKAFVPETLFNTLGESNDQIQFRVTYIYPPIGLSFCPDTIIKHFRFVPPVNVNYSILSPTTLPYCHGDTMRLQVNNSSPNDKFYWNFGDGISKEADSLTSSYYLYSRPGKYILRFKSIVDILPTGTCNNDILDTVRIGAKPIADFVVSNHYENQLADFSSLAVLKMENQMTDNGQVDELDSWSWDFGDGNVSLYQTDSLEDNQYAYYKSKPYTVTHVVGSGWGCADTVVKEIPVFPVIDFSVNNFFAEDYDVTDSTGFYQSGDYNIGGNSSWKYQPPAGDSLIIGTSPAWVTENNKIDTAYNFDEFSWVESPVFLFDQLNLPMLSIDTWSLTENQLDGACLQWAFADTTFGNEQWQTIGIKGQGVNWYNSNIVVGMLNKVKKVGLHTPGWTGSTGDEWQRSRFNLDNIKALAGSRPVRFRILFVSNSDNAPGQYDGFAFDNFYIGERNRKVLVEEFCDYQHYEPEFEVSPFKDNEQLVRMQYHTRYMTLDDEINNQNKGETGARNLLYGFSELPRAAVDGSYSLDFNAGFFGTPTTVGIGEQNFDKRLLELSPFSISISVPSPVLTNNELQFSVTMTRDSVIATQGPFVLQVAVLEKQVTANGIDFTNVFRKFLPDAGGEHVDKNQWPKENSKILQRNFVPYTPLAERGDGDTSLILVAFIQDEATSEVYQTEVRYLLYGEVKNLSVVPMPARLGTTEPLISLYPNPAQSKLTVRFENGNTISEYEYRIVDGFGKVVINGQIQKDTYETTFTGLQDLPVGLYQLQLLNGGTVFSRSFSLIR